MLEDRNGHLCYKKVFTDTLIAKNIHYLLMPSQSQQDTSKAALSVLCTAAAS